MLSSLIVLGGFAIGATAQGSVPISAPSPSPSSSQSIQPFDENSLWISRVMNDCWQKAFGDEAPMLEDAVGSCSSNGIDSVINEVNSHASSRGCPAQLFVTEQAHNVYSQYCSSVIKAVSSPAPATTTALTTDSNSIIFSPSTTDSTNPGPTSSSGTSVAPSTVAASASETASTGTSLPLQHKSSGLSGNTIIGLGVGLGVGIPLVLGIAAAIFFLRKRRTAQGPYGAVRSIDKGGMEDGSPSMGPQEMRPTSYESPFLPPLVAPSRKPLPPTPVACERQPMSPNDAESDMRHSDDFHPAQSSHAVYNDHRIQPMDEHDHEPPSPVSPMTPTGSRPASLRLSPRNHHDL